MLVHLSVVQAYLQLTEGAEDLKKLSGFRELEPIGHMTVPPINTFLVATLVDVDFQRYLHGWLAKHDTFDQEEQLSF